MATCGQRTTLRYWGCHAKHPVCAAPSEAKGLATYPLPKVTKQTAMNPGADTTMVVLERRSQQERLSQQQARFAAVRTAAVELQAVRPQVATAAVRAAAPPPPVREPKLVYFEDERGDRSRARYAHADPGTAAPAEPPAPDPLILLGRSELRRKLSEARRTNKEARQLATLLMRPPTPGRLIEDENGMALEELRDELKKITDDNEKLKRRAEARATEWGPRRAEPQAREQPWPRLGTSFAIRINFCTLLFCTISFALGVMAARGSCSGSSRSSTLDCCSWLPALLRMLSHMCMIDAPITICTGCCAFMALAHVTRGERCPGLHPLQCISRVCVAGGQEGLGTGLRRLGCACTGAAFGDAGGVVCVSVDTRLCVGRARARFFLDIVSIE